MSQSGRLSMHQNTYIERTHEFVPVEENGLYRPKVNALVSTELSKNKVLKRGDFKTLTNP